MDLRPRRRIALDSLGCEPLAPRRLPASGLATPLTTVRELGSVSGPAALAGVEAVAAIAPGESVRFRFHLDEGGHYLLLVRHTGPGLALVADTPAGPAALPVGAAGPFETIPLDLAPADYAVTASATGTGGVFVDWELLMQGSVGRAALGRPIGMVPVAIQSSAGLAGAGPSATAASLTTTAPAAIGPASAPNGLAAPNQGIVTPSIGGQIDACWADRPPAGSPVAWLRRGVPAPGSPAEPARPGPASASPRGPVPAEAWAVAAAGEGDRPPQAGRLSVLASSPAPPSETARTRSDGRPGRDAPGGVELTAGLVGFGLAVGATTLGLRLRRRRASVVEVPFTRVGPYAPRSLLRSILRRVDGAEADPASWRDLQPPSRQAGRGLPGRGRAC